MSEPIFIPGSVAFNELSSQLKSISSQFKDSLPSSPLLKKCVDLAVTSLPTLIYQLEQEFKVDNPSSSLDFAKLLSWQVQKGYYSKDLFSKLEDAEQQKSFLYAMWLSLLLLGSLNKVKQTLLPKIEANGISVYQLLDELIRFAPSGPSFSNPFNSPNIDYFDAQDEDDEDDEDEIDNEGGFQS